MTENLTIGSTECIGFGTTNPNAVLTVNGEDYKLGTLTLDGLLYVPAFRIDFREANRQLMTVTAKGEITFADDLTLDEAKYIIQEILKWKISQ